jgi:hypothetical protein
MSVHQQLNVFVYSQVAGTLAVPPSDVPCCGRPAQASKDDEFVPTRDTTDIAAEAPDGDTGNKEANGQVPRYHVQLQHIISTIPQHNVYTAYNIM